MPLLPAISCDCCCWVQATPTDEHFAPFLRGEWTCPASFSTQLAQLLSGLWALDPKQRLTITQVAEHPWLALPDEAPPLVLKAAGPPPAPVVNASAVTPQSSMSMDVESEVRASEEEELAVQSLSDEFVMGAQLDGSEAASPQNRSGDVMQAADMFGCEPTMSESSKLPVARVVERVTALFTENGGTVEVVEQDESRAEIDAAFNDANHSWWMPMCKMFVMADGKSGSTIAVKRMQGCSVAFSSIHKEFKPKLAEQLELVVSVP